MSFKEALLELLDAPRNTNMVRRSQPRCRFRLNVNVNTSPTVEFLSGEPTVEDYCANDFELDN